MPKTVFGLPRVSTSFDLISFRTSRSNHVTSRAIFCDSLQDFSSFFRRFSANFKWQILETIFREAMDFCAGDAEDCNRVLAAEIEGLTEITRTSNAEVIVEMIGHRNSKF